MTLKTKKSLRSHFSLKTKLQNLKVQRKDLLKDQRLEDLDQKTYRPPSDLNHLVDFRILGDEKRLIQSDA